MTNLAELGPTPLSCLINTGSFFLVLLQFAQMVRLVASSPERGLPLAINQSSYHGAVLVIWWPGKSKTAVARYSFSFTIIVCGEIFAVKLQGLGAFFHPSMAPYERREK